MSIILGLAKDYAVGVLMTLAGLYVIGSIGKDRRIKKEG